MIIRFIENIDGVKFFGDIEKSELPIIPDGVSEGNKFEFKNITYRGRIKNGRHFTSYFFSNSNKHLNNKDSFAEESQIDDALLDALDNYVEKSRESLTKKVRTLFHNVRTLNGNNSTELEKIFPPSLFRNDIHEYLKGAGESISKRLTETALSLLKIYKDTEGLKNEIIVFDAMENEAFNPHFQIHVIFKLIVDSLYKFYSSFLEKGIYIHMDNNELAALLDYKTFSVILFHFFDNATKYAMPGESINIRFIEDENGGLSVDFEMWSIIINDEELNEICKDGVRGESAKRDFCDNGSGLGLFYINKLAELNKFVFQITPGEMHRNEKGIDYSDNVFSFKFPKDRLVDE